MKTPQKNTAVIAAIFGAAMAVGPVLAQAQENGSTSQTSSTDSITALAAGSQNLPQIAPTAVPMRGGTYWLVYPGGLTAPAPCLPPDVTGGVFQIGSGEFIVDQTSGRVLVNRWQLVQANGNTEAAVTAQVQGLIDLITWVQTPTPTNAAASTMALLAQPMGGGFSPMDLTQTGYPYLAIAPTGTNQLLITVMNTNQATYYLQMTPVLGDTNYPYAIIANGVVGQSNFLVNAGPYNDEFFRVLMTTNIPGQGIAVFIDSPANGANVQ